MSTLKSVNWALGWRRFIWTAFFAAFYALVVYMAKDMAGAQPVVFGIILLAAIVCAVAFVYSKRSREACVIALLALCVHAFLEISYWSSVVDDTSTLAMREQSAAASRDIVNEKRRARYAASASGKGAGQLAAEIKALEQDARWTSSAQCTDATAPASRAFCQDYYRTAAEHAAAKEAANLEKTVFHTSVERVDIPRNLAKGALWLSDMTGLSVRSATNILVGLMVLFIQAGVALCLRIGWEPQEPMEAAGAHRTAAKPSGATTLPATSVSPVYAAAARSEMRPRKDVLEKVLGVLPNAGKNQVSGDVSKNPADHVRDIAKVTPVSADYAPTAEQIAENANCSPDPDGPGTPAAAPEAPAEEPDNVLPFKASHDTTADWKIDRRASENSVTRWLRDRTQASATRRGNEAHKLLPDYLRYCRQRGETPLSKRKFSTVLRGELDLPKLRGADGKRKSAVMLFPIELVTTQTAKRKVA